METFLLGKRKGCTQISLAFAVLHRRAGMAVSTEPRTRVPVSQ